jgi:hypothetical protein
MLNATIRPTCASENFDVFEPTECRIDEPRPSGFADLREDDIRLSLRMRAVAINVVAGFEADGGSCEIIVVGRVKTPLMQDDVDGHPAEVEFAFGRDGRMRSMTISVIDPTASRNHP